MSVREGAALHVLTGQTNVHSLLQERSKREGLSHSPVQLPLVHHRVPGLPSLNVTVRGHYSLRCSPKPVLNYLENSLHCPVYLEVRSVGRTLGEPTTDVDQRLLDDAGVRHLQWVLPLKKAGPGRVDPMFVENLTKDQN